jgi:hypothetical protein
MDFVLMIVVDIIMMIVSCLALNNHSLAFNSSFNLDQVRLQSTLDYYLCWFSYNCMPNHTFSLLLTRNFNFELQVKMLLGQSFQPVLTQLLNFLQRIPLQDFVSKVIEGCGPKRSSEICQFNRYAVLSDDLFVIGPTMYAFVE